MCEVPSMTQDDALCKRRDERARPNLRLCFLAAARVELRADCFLMAAIYKEEER
jgi:hypothetical protein